MFYFPSKVLSRVNDCKRWNRLDRSFIKITVYILVRNPLSFVFTIVVIIESAHQRTPKCNREKDTETSCQTPGLQ